MGKRNAMSLLLCVLCVSKIEPLTSGLTMSTATEKIPVRVGHSPDADDAFMFYALSRDCLDTGRYHFTHELVDIETLNRRAFSGELELTALSLHAYAYLADKYMLCSCGASFGDDYGPMVVARQPMTRESLQTATIAVPGTLTTAFLSLQLWLGGPCKHVVVPFNEMLDIVEAGSYNGPDYRCGPGHSRRAIDLSRARLVLDRRYGQVVASAKPDIHCRSVPTEFVKISVCP